MHPKIKRFPLLILLLGACLFAACGPGTFKGPRLKFTLELDLGSWLAEQSPSAADSSFQVMLGEFHRLSTNMPGKTWEAFEQTIREKAPLGALRRWFPQFSQPTATDKEIMDHLHAEWQAAMDHSYMVLRRRLERDPRYAAEIEKTPELGRLIVKLNARSADPAMEIRLLRMRGQLGFYETFTLGELRDDLDRVARFSKDTTAVQDKFEFYKMLTLPENPSPMGQENWDDGRATLGFVQITDTSQLMQMLKRASSAGKVDRDVVWAWTQNELLKTDNAMELIALRATSGKPALSGQVVTAARAENDLNGHVSINLNMNAEGAAAWEALTKKNIQKQIAIVIDGFAYSVPTVQSEISGGRSQITGDFSTEEAQFLADVIAGGELPVRVVILGQEEVLKK